MRFTIRAHWDGRPLPEQEHTHLDVALVGDALVLTVDAPYGGNPPPATPPGPTAKLWEHEVVELFVVADEQEYLEIELGPHGHHLVLRLAGIRNIVQDQLPIEYTAAIDGARWRGEARVPRAYLPARARTCNVYRVAGAGPTRTWQALAAVPGERPDFHRLEYFVPWMLG